MAIIMKTVFGLYMKKSNANSFSHLFIEHLKFNPPFTPPYTLRLLSVTRKRAEIESISQRNNARAMGIHVMPPYLRLQNR